MQSEAKAKQAADAFFRNGPVISPLSTYDAFLAGFTAALSDKQAGKVKAAALAVQTQQGVEPAPHVYALGIEFNGVSAALEYGKGLWRTCTGCHESNEGYPTGPYSIVMKCHLGGGCFECGGIGAIWDTTDYEEMGRYLSDERFGGAAETVSVDRSLLQAAINEIRKWKVEKGGDDQVVLNLEASMRSEGSDND